MNAARRTSTLTVTVVQAELRWHDPAANRKTFGDVVDALDEPTDLIVLPEMFTTGFTMEAAKQSEPMDGETLSWMRETARAAGAAICGSIAIDEDGRRYNRLVLMDPGGRHAIYDKRHLFRLAGEHERYAAGGSIETVSLRDWRIRPLVCYDLRFPVWSRRTHEHDYDLLLYVANWPKPRHHAWRALLRARAIENQCYVAAVNRTGEDGNGKQYGGGSAIVDYLGHDVADLGDTVGVATKTLDLEALREFRRDFPFQDDADAFALK